MISLTLSICFLDYNWCLWNLLQLSIENSRIPKITMLPMYSCPFYFHIISMATCFLSQVCSWYLISMHHLFFWYGLYSSYSSMCHKYVILIVLTILHKHTAHTWVWKEYELKWCHLHLSQEHTPHTWVCIFYIFMVSKETTPEYL